MKRFFKNPEILPEVLALLHIHDDYKVYDSVTHLHTVLACGYTKMTEEKRRQFVEGLKSENEDTSWIPFITNEEKTAYYDRRAKEQGKKTIAEEAEANKRQKEAKEEREKKLEARLQRNA